MARAAAQTGEAWYEVESLRRERWLIEAVARDRQAALEEAGRLLRREDVAGIRVRRERLHPRWGFGGGWTVLEHVKPGPRRAPAPEPAALTLPQLTLEDALSLLLHEIVPSSPRAGWLARVIRRVRQE